MTESPAKQTRKMDRLKRKSGKIRTKAIEASVEGKYKKVNRLVKKGKKVAAKYEKAGDKAVKKGKLTKRKSYDYDSDPERRYND